MQRRPWPLVILALLQILGPFGSIFLSARVNHVTTFEMASAIWRFSRPIDLMVFYGLPIFSGLLIFFAKRFGYFIVIGLSLVSIYLNISEWRLASDVISIPMLMGVTATNLALIGYLLLPNVRAVFMNSRLRWWENAPRYTVSMRGQLSKTEGHATPCEIVDLAVGGAGLKTDSAPVVNGDSVLLTFDYEEHVVLMRGIAVYGRPDGTGHRYGLEWQRGSEMDERRFMALLVDLEEKRTPITRTPPKWKEDLKAWASRATKSPSAWVPEVPKKK
ncbi:MAG: PilZ domain-containing protein [Cryobacterium sp.]|nr:PilZ domain-containing protein [Oligoflexia bacterium]